MNDKKGRLISEASVKLVISVLVLVMLIGLLIAVYYILVAENELQKIKKQMDKLEEITKKVHQSGKLSTVDFFPIKGWYLKSFNYGDKGFDGFPPGACVDNRAESCLCVCEYLNCEKFDCRWFDFKVFIAEEHRVINYPDATEAQMGYSPPDDVYSGTFQLRESIYQFEIAKEGIESEEIVSIMQVGTRGAIRMARERQIEFEKRQEKIEEFLDPEVDEQEKLVNAITSAFDPLFEIKNDREGSPDYGKNFVEKFGLNSLSKNHADLKNRMEIFGWRDENYEEVLEIYFDFQKGEGVKEIVEAADKICNIDRSNRYIIETPLGVITEGGLKGGDVHALFNSMTLQDFYSIPTIHEINYKGADMEIKFRVWNDCLKP